MLRQIMQSSVFMARFIALESPPVKGAGRGPAQDFSFYVVRLPGAGIRCPQFVTIERANRWRRDSFFKSSTANSGLFLG